MNKEADAALRPPGVRLPSHQRSNPRQGDSLQRGHECPLFFAAKNMIRGKVSSRVRQLSPLWRRLSRIIADDTLHCEHPKPLWAMMASSAVVSFSFTRTTGRTSNTSSFSSIPLKKNCPFSWLVRSVGEISYWILRSSSVKRQSSRRYGAMSLVQVSSFLHALSGIAISFPRYRPNPYRP